MSDILDYADYDLVSDEGSHLLDEAEYPPTAEEEPLQFQNHHNQQLEVHEEKIEEE
jgi:hypothetical protein